MSRLLSSVMDSAGTGKEPVTCSYEHGNTFSEYIKCVEFD
jgi:hypothetical protein